MQGILSKAEIITQLQQAAQELTGYCSAIDSEKFFSPRGEKWSVAENVLHLTASADITRLAYQLPKFIVRLYAGKPNRASRAYDELLSRYKLKLEQGGKASGRYIPKKIKPSNTREKMLVTYTRVMDRLTARIDHNWKDEHLDKYLAPHPLLGKITLRELGYFTIFHTYHHLATIKKESSL
jgi:uncharacterized damage-inducible protein DinB